MRIIIRPYYSLLSAHYLLLRRMLDDLRAQGICAVHLITAGEGALPELYARFGFSRETEVMLMGMEM